MVDGGSHLFVFAVKPPQEEIRNTAVPPPALNHTLRGQPVFSKDGNRHSPARPSPVLARLTKGDKTRRHWCEAKRDRTPIFVNDDDYCHAHLV